jgi:hypothetical protein
MDKESELVPLGSFQEPDSLREVQRQRPMRLIEKEAQSCKQQRAVGNYIQQHLFFPFEISLRGGGAKRFRIVTQTSRQHDRISKFLKLMYP